GSGYLTALSTASLSVARATAGSLVTIYSSGLAAAAAQPPGATWPDTLGDVMVRVTDSAGAAAFAGLLYVSPDQINLQMPAAMAPGRARIAVLRGGAIVAAGSMQIAPNAPAIFTANSAGFGLAAAQVIRVKPDGAKIYEPVFPGPIGFDEPGERLF